MNVAFLTKNFSLQVKVQISMHTLLDIFEPFSLEEQSMSSEDCKLQNDVHVAVQEMKEICFYLWI